MNKFRRFLGRILAETCLKIDYLGSKSSKITKCWRLRLQNPTLIQIADADAWQFGSKTKLRIYIFCPHPTPPVQKTFSRHWNWGEFLCNNTIIHSRKCTSPSFSCIPLCTVVLWIWIFWIIFGTGSFSATLYRWKMDNDPLCPCGLGEEQYASQIVQGRCLIWFRLMWFRQHLPYRYLYTCSKNDVISSIRNIIVL